MNERARHSRKVDKKKDNIFRGKDENTSAGGKKYELFESYMISYKITQTLFTGI